MKRILAHHIILNGERFGLSVAEISRDGKGLWSVKVSPFERETAGTVFHSGTVVITEHDDRTVEPEVIFM